MMRPAARTPPRTIPARSIVGARARGLAASAWVLAAVACRPPSAAPAAPSIALAEQGENLYVADGAAIRIFELSPRRGPGRARTEPSPCAAIVDLDHFSGHLYALCDDGRIFARRLSEYDGAAPPGAWRDLEVAGAGGPRADATPAIALQRSDNALFVVRDDGALDLVAPAWRDRPASALDRFRGPDRGGPGELPVAAFREYEPDYAHGFARRRGVELTAVLELDAFTCRVPGRGAAVHDLAISRFAIAAVHVSRGGRARVVVVHHHGQRRRRPYAGVYEAQRGGWGGLVILCFPP